MVARKKPVGKETSKPKQTRDRVNRWLVAVTPDERAEIRLRALKAGKPVSTYMRECALGEPPRPMAYASVRLEVLRLAGELPDGPIKDGLIKAARRLE